jgi:hypothetical protein
MTTTRRPCRSLGSRSASARGLSSLCGILPFSLEEKTRSGTALVPAVAGSAAAARAHVRAVIIEVGACVIAKVIVGVPPAPLGDQRYELTYIPALAGSTQHLTQRLLVAGQHLKSAPAISTAKLKKGHSSSLSSA